MINQQDQWFNQLRREESARRTLRYSLYQALEQVERLLESDMMEVPIEMQARLRQIVEAVDRKIAPGQRRAGGPRRQRAEERYRLWPRFLSTFPQRKQAQKTLFCAVFRGCALTPETPLRPRFAARIDA